MRRDAGHMAKFAGSPAFSRVFWREDTLWISVGWPHLIEGTLGTGGAIPNPNNHSCY